MTSNSADNAGTVLFLLATHDSQTAAQLIKDSRLSPAEITRQLQRLTEFGFILAGSPNATAVSAYRLHPKGVRIETIDSYERILVVEDTEAVRNVVSTILEDEGYAVIATRVPADAVTLLQQVDFDLVITDSYSSIPSDTFTSTVEVLQAAGTTPVALFTAHRIELSDAQAAGFHDVIGKPFDMDVLIEQVRTLLSS